MKMHRMVGLAAVAVMALGVTANASVIVSSDGAVAIGSPVTYSSSATITGQGTPNAAETLGNGAVQGGTQAIVGSGTTFTVPAAGGAVTLTNFELGLSAIVSGQAYQLNLYSITSDPNSFPVATAGPNLLGQSTTIPANGGSGTLYGFALSGTDSPTLAPGAYVLGVSTAGTTGFIFRGPDGAYAGGTAVINGLQASSGANRDAVFSLTLASAPEPASLGVLGVGALGLLARRRRRA